MVLTYRHQGRKDLHNSCEFWPSSICGDIKWFIFQSVMMHTSNNRNISSDILQTIVKSIFNVQDKDLI